jgi:putative Mg2+ transporter-C (MgtC) family protein
MNFIHTFNGHAFLDTIVSYFSAFLFGTLIGAERQYRQRTAGLRTNVLVAVGAAAFVDLAQRIAGDVEAVRVISYVVSGIGFLGAGVIMKDGTNVQGLNTAATLWCSAAVGACTGCDMVAEGGLLTVFVIAGNTLLRPLVNAINRVPLQGRGVEASYTVSVLTDHAHVDILRDLLVKHLEQAHFPVADIELTDRGMNQVEIAATLTSTTVDKTELQRVIAHLDTEHAVAHVSWMVTSEA